MGVGVLNGDVETLGDAAEGLGLIPNSDSSSGD